MTDPQIIPSRLAITAMRDSGYKNTAYALAELIDNAQQAGASRIEVLCFEKEELVSQRRRSRDPEDGSAIRERDPAERPFRDWPVWYGLA